MGEALAQEAQRVGEVDAAGAAGGAEGDERAPVRGAAAGGAQQVGGTRLFGDHGPKILIVDLQPA
jgi:hypothetical protein